MQDKSYDMWLAEIDQTAEELGFTRMQLLKVLFQFSSISKLFQWQQLSEYLYRCANAETKGNKDDL